MFSRKIEILSENCEKSQKVPSSLDATKSGEVQVRLPDPRMVQFISGMDLVLEIERFESIGRLVPKLVFLFLSF